jgi:O-antigen/teichoic acid export membrane protein
LFSDSKPYRAAPAYLVTAGIASQDSAADRPQGGPQRPAAGERSVAGRIRQVVSESLFRNSAFLSTNVAVGAVTGLATLTLLTHLYSVRAIGLSAAALSATSLITTVSQLGLNYSLVRFLPTSPHRTELINSVLTATMLVALAGSVVFLVLPSADRLYALGGVAFAALFLLSTGFNAGTSQLMNIFVADRAAGDTVRPTMLGGLARVVSPVALVFLGLSGAYVAQGVVPAGVDFLILAVMLRRRGQRFRPTLSRRATRDLGRFSLGTYVASLIGGLPQILLPLIILSRFGSSQNAFWYAAISGASLLFAVPGSVSQALLAEASHQPAARRALVRKSAIMIISVMVPVLTVAYVAAPWALALLGHHYAAEGLATLRLLIIAAGMSSVNYITGTILYLAKKTFIIAAINLVDAVVVIGLAVTWSHNARGVAVAWVAGEVANVVLFSLFAVISLRQVGWRWEALGGDQTTPPVTESDLYYATIESQQAGLDMLLRLSAHGMTGPIYPPGQRPPPRQRPPDPSPPDRTPPDRSPPDRRDPDRRDRY